MTALAWFIVIVAAILIIGPLVSLLPSRPHKPQNKKASDKDAERPS